MHDAESYNDSYNYAAKSIKSFIAQYPSISYVLDLHRDAIQYEDGSIARPTIKTDLGDTAQLMFVIGTDELGANHPNWEKISRLRSDYKARSTAKPQILSVLYLCAEQHITNNTPTDQF